VKAVVFGYHEIGYVCLEELLDAKVEVSALFTHDDDPSEEIWFRRPAMLARERSIPLYTPINLKDKEWTDLVQDLSPDVIFSFYYRTLIPGDILKIPPVGAFNLHGSLLPRFRGRCPVNWVLIEGETRTGVTLHVMEEKADTGDIIDQRAVDISWDDTARSLFQKLVVEARLLVRHVLPLLESGKFTREPQTGPHSYYGGRKPDDGLVVWTRDVRSIYNLVRATTHPYPGAFTFLDGRKCLIWKALPLDGDSGRIAGTVISEQPFVVQTGRGELQLLRVQLEGEPEVDGDLFALAHGLKNTLLGGQF